MQQSKARVFHGDKALFSLSLLTNFQSKHRQFKEPPNAAEFERGDGYVHAKILMRFYGEIRLEGTLRFAESVPNLGGYTE